MNKERQIQKDIENRQLHVRDEYAKNKSLYVENKLKEKAKNHPHPHKSDSESEKNK